MICALWNAGSPRDGRSQSGLLVKIKLFSCGSLRPSVQVGEEEVMSTILD
jgi:hypothetical protein